MIERPLLEKFGDLEVVWMRPQLKAAFLDFPLKLVEVRHFLLEYFMSNCVTLE